VPLVQDVPGIALLVLHEDALALAEALHLHDVDDLGELVLVEVLEQRCLEQEVEDLLEGERRGHPDLRARS
jgi:hypothetical protein